MNSNRLQQLQILTGKLTPQRGTILCGVAGTDPAEGWSLSGKIIGPYIANSSTLPATFTIRDAGQGPAVLGVGQILDPVCWSPDLPARYRVEVELLRNGEVVERTERMLGVRWLEARDGGFYWQGRRKLLRGIGLEGAQLLEQSLPIEEWKQAELTAWIDAPTVEACEFASKHGVPLVVQLAGTENSLLTQTLQQWNQHAAVMAVVLPAAAVVDRQEVPRSALLLAADLRKCEALEAPSWADAILVNEAQLAAVSDQTAGLPIIVVANRDVEQSPAASRAECDRLRAELASVRQCAGYIIATAISASIPSSD